MLLRFFGASLTTPSPAADKAVRAPNPRRLRGDFRGVFAAGGVGFEGAADFVADLAEDGEDLVFGAFGFGGVVEGPVVAIHLAGEDGAGLVGVAADGDDGFDFLGEEFVEVFGAVGGDVDTDFGHDFDGEGVDVTGGFGAGALDVEEVSGGGAEDAFGEVAAAGISGAEDQDGGFHFWWV
jgi:hypothetical protein